MHLPSFSHSPLASLHLHILLPTFFSLSFSYFLYLCFLTSSFWLPSHSLPSFPVSFLSPSSSRVPCFYLPHSFLTIWFCFSPFHHPPPQASNPSSLSCLLSLPPSLPPPPPLSLSLSLPLSLPPSLPPSIPTPSINNSICKWQQYKAWMQGVS